VISGGKIMRNDDGSPIMVREYSDNLLLALLKATSMTLGDLVLARHEAEGQSRACRGYLEVTPNR
jgi:hypothetical protein